MERPRVHGQLGSTRRLRLLIVLSVLVTVPFVAGAVGAHLDGWYPAGDDAKMLHGVGTVFSSEPPALGQETSGGRYGEAANHPGPLMFYVYAPFVAVLGGPAGLLAGAAAISATSMVGIGWVANRVGGASVALWAWLCSFAVVWSIGGVAYLHSPLHVVIAFLPMLLALTLSWALIGGHLELAAPWVLAVSYTAQAHVQYLVFMAPLVAATLVFSVLSQRQSVRGGRFEGQEGSATAALGPSLAMRRHLLMAAGIGLVVWVGPLVDVLVRRGGNVTAMWKATTAATTEPRGLTSGLALLGRALLLDPVTTRSLDAAAGGFIWVVPVVVLVAAAVWLALSRQTTGGPVARMRLLYTVWVLVITVAVAARLPADEGFAFIRLQFVSAAAGFAVIAVGAAVIAFRRPARVLSRNVGQLRMAATGVLVVGLIGVSVPLPVDDRWAYSPWTYRVVPDLASQLSEQLQAGEAWDIRPLGPRPLLLVSLGVASVLERHDIRTNLPEPPTFGRGPRQVEKFDGVLYVVPAYVEPGPGWRLLARHDEWGFDSRRADQVARALTDHASTTGAVSTDFLESSLGGILCPLAVAPCEDGELRRSSRRLDELPGWLIVWTYLEHYDELLSSELLVGAEPPRNLLEQARQTFGATPVAVYQAPA